VTRANVSSAARIAAGGIGGTFGVVASLAISLYTDAGVEEGPRPDERFSGGSHLLGAGIVIGSPFFG
jgi:hypothetical protein